MKLLIATHAYLLLSDVEKNTSKIIDEGHFYGLTRMPDGNIITSKRIWLDEGRPPKLSENKLHVWTPDFSEWIGTIPFYGKDIHQIHWANDGLYICDCARNHIVHVSGPALAPEAFGEKFTLKEHIFNGTAYDINHPNSLHVLPNRQVAVILHNKSNGPSEVAILQHREDGPLELQTTIELPHYGAHNVLVADEDTIIYNASDAGKTVRFDLTKREVLAEQETGGYTKGLLVTDDYLVVGTSEQSEFQDRFHSHGEILMIPRHKDVEPTTFTPLADRNCGNINEFMLIDG